MTSMMDIFVTLLFFLLKSFVAEGEVLTPPPGVQLPVSSSELPPTPSVVVAVVGNTILVGDRAVARIDEGDPGDLWIEPLARELARVKAQAANLAALRGTVAGERGKAAVQGDRNLEFRVLQRVLYTLSGSGFEDVSLAVIQRS
jgi:biopolymer transport protein ExbD